VSQPSEPREVPGSSTADIAANEEGRLSPAQRRELMSAFPAKALGATLFAVLTVGFAAAGIWLAVVWLALCALLIAGVTRDLRAANGAPVRAVDGHAWAESVPDDEGDAAYFVHIDQLRLTTSKAMFLGLRAGGPYRIYYVPDHKRAVAARRLPGWLERDLGWEEVVAELQSMTEQALGSRAKKVKDILAQADRSRAGLEAAIDSIPGLSMLFVDASRLKALAGDLRSRLGSVSP
jgi:hypothetical protein